MKKNTAAFILFFGVFLFLSCQKRKVSNGHPELIGTWKHNKSATELFKIIIEKSSWGHQEWYMNGAFDHKTSNRKWYVKDDRLEFAYISSGADIFSIDQYPQVASSRFVHEFDTIQAGRLYMKLGGHYYVSE